MECCGRKVHRIQGESGTLGTAAELIVDFRGASNSMNSIMNQRRADFARRDWLALTAVIVLSGTIVLADPVGYIGGRWDDGRYLEAALEWVRAGPVLGHDHWALRWPVVATAAVSINMFGLSPVSLMLPGLVAFSLLLAITFAGVRLVTGDRTAAIVSALAVTTAIVTASAATRLTADLPETLSWCAALWSLVAATRQSGRAQAAWLLATGISCGLAWAVRETALGLGLVFAVAVVAGPTACRLGWRWGWVVAGALLIALPEQLALWQASGNIAYRIATDLHHVEIASTHLAGGTGHGESAPFNAGIAARWDGAGPVHLHWPIDPWLNLLLNAQYGLNFLSVAILAWTGRVSQRGALRAQGLRWLAVIVAANLITVVYIIATDPKPRMFMPAAVAAATLLGPLATAAWYNRQRWLVGGLATAKLVVFVIGMGVATRFTWAPELAEQVLAGVPGAVSASRVTRTHLALAPVKLTRRLDGRGPSTPLLVLGKAGERVDLPPGQWREIARAQAPPTAIAALARRIGFRNAGGVPQATLWRCTARCGPLNGQPSVGVGQ